MVLGQPAHWNHNRDHYRMTDIDIFIGKVFKEWQLIMSNISQYGVPMVVLKKSRLWSIKKVQKYFKMYL